VSAGPKTTGDQAGAGSKPAAASSEAVRRGILAERHFVEIRFGGSGGQGIVLMGLILATAGTRDNRCVVQTESYGPEARGGYSRSDIIISDNPIDYPQLEDTDLLVVLSQAAANQYVGSLRPGGVLVYDSERVTKLPLLGGTGVGIPFTRLALEETGREQTANILTLGAVVGLTGVVSVESLRKAVMGRVPAGTEEVNGKALARGLALDAADWQSSGVTAESC
jgi:2-oxoglutarate ferredoxin oxidoreductase subunit gamma